MQYSNPTLAIKVLSDLQERLNKLVEEKHSKITKKKRTKNK